MKRTSLGLVAPWLALAALLCETAVAGSITFDVETTVGGNANTKIGSITATMAGPSAADPNADFVETGKFTFTAPWGQLDNCYDFRWYQIITSAPNDVLNSPDTKFKDKDGNYTVSPVVPFVDPPAGGYKYQEADGGADNDPFYSNSGNGNYAYPNIGDLTVPNVSVETDDNPGPVDVFFETYLVVTGGDIAANTFAVLAGYSWNTDLDNAGFLADPDPVELNAWNLAALQTALTNSGFKEADYNNKWTVIDVTNLQECPEPSTCVLAVLAVAGVCGFARRGRLRGARCERCQA